MDNSENVDEMASLLGSYLLHKSISFVPHSFTLLTKNVRSSVAKCLTRSQGVLDSSSTGSSVFFFFFFPCVGMYLGKTLQSPSLVLVKPRKDMNNMSCRRDMTEILLKAA